MASTPAPAPPGPVAGTRYVALGDSYTAGPRIGPVAGPPAGCERSVNDYPHLFAAASEAELRDVSCGGARIDDLSDAQPVSGGLNPPQLAALDARTELVTVGIGGNDLGFAEIVRSCLSASPTATPCRDRFAAGGDDELRARIDALGPRLTTTYAAIARRAPAARRVVVGYPSVLPAAGSGCFPALPVSPGDVTYLRGVLTALNDEIRGRAQQAGAVYVDTAGPSVGHDVCAAPGTAWVEGVLPAAPGIPLHPNALGHAAIAQAVRAAL